MTSSGTVVASSGDESYTLPSRREISSGAVVSSSGNQQSVVSSSSKFSDHSYCSRKVAVPLPVEPVDLEVSLCNVRDSIIVVDAIDPRFHSSSDIYKEINSLAPGVPVESAYLLSRGGLAIHLSSKAERDSLFDLLPSNCFGGDKKKLPSLKQIPIYVKDVPLEIVAEKLPSTLSSSGLLCFSASRVISRYTGRISRTVKLYVSEDCAGYLISHNLYLNSKIYLCERKQLSVTTRCFNCQRFGHISANCRSSVRCEKCAGPHHISLCKSDHALCANCNQSHQASFSKCSHYESAATKLSILPDV